MTVVDPLPNVDQVIPDRSRVRALFDWLAPDYDVAVLTYSLAQDLRWKSELVRRLRPRRGERALDLACGTGLIYDRLERRLGREAIVGLDLNRAMLTAARRDGAGRRVVHADCVRLPFRDAAFDLVTAAFGFRNLANYEQGVREIARVLKPGGEFGILEFSEPSRGPMAPLFRFYFRRILPLVGGAISGSLEAYSYLPRSVSKFPSPRELSLLLESNGFTEVKASSWNFGSVILHRAERN